MSEGEEEEKEEQLLHLNQGESNEHSADTSLVDSEKILDDVIENQPDLGGILADKESTSLISKSVLEKSAVMLDEEEEEILQLNQGELNEPSADSEKLLNDVAENKSDLNIISNREFFIEVFSVFITLLIGYTLLNYIRY